MAKQDIDDIIATADGDTTWGDDMRGAFTTLKARIGLDAGFDLTRAAAGTRRALTALWGSATTTSCQPGGYRLSMSYVMGGYTPTTVVLANCGTANTSGNSYVVIYNIGPGDGFPTTLAASWTFDLTTIGTKTLTSQTTAMPETGWYWVGMMVSNSAVGTPVVDSNTPTFQPFAMTDERNFVLQLNTSDTTPSDLSAATGFDLGRFASTPAVGFA